jgi:hypothetical protein
MFLALHMPRMIQIPHVADALHSMLKAREALVGMALLSRRRSRFRKGTP